MFRRSFIFIFIFISSFLLIATSSQAAAPENVMLNMVTADKSGSSLEPFLAHFSRDANTFGALDLIADILHAPPDVIKGIVSDSSKNWIPGGAFGATNQMIAGLYNPPASGAQYIAQEWNSFLGKPAYAQSQGVGFVGLQPILSIWRAFRNIVYLISSLLFIIIGIMVMLRVKVSPQAVVTVQNAIPQLVTTLILVTFSYAIAGLVIDGMTLIQGFALAALFSAKGVPLDQGLFTASGLSNISTTFFGNLTGFFNFDGLSHTGFINFFNLSFLLVPKGILYIVGGFIGTVLVGIIGTLLVPGGVGTLGGAVLGFPIGGVLILLAISILILFWMFKFFFGALKCYVTAIFKIITGPLEIALGAFPNSKMGFNSWIWDLIANLSVFPVSVIFLVISNLIIEASGNQLWAPALIGGRLTNLPASLDGGVIAVFIGIGALSIMSRLPEMIPEFVFMLKPSPWSKAIGEGLKPENIPLVGRPYADYQAARSKERGQMIFDQIRDYRSTAKSAAGFGAKDAAIKEPKS